MRSHLSISGRNLIVDHVFFAVVAAPVEAPSSLQAFKKIRTTLLLRRKTIGDTCFPILFHLFYIVLFYQGCAEFLGRFNFLRHCCFAERNSFTRHPIATIFVVCKTRLGGVCRLYSLRPFTTSWALLPLSASRTPYRWVSGDFGCFCHKQRNCFPHAYTHTCMNTQETQASKQTAGQNGMQYAWRITTD